MEWSDGVDLPYEMSFVGHRLDCIDGPAASWELEVAVRFAALAAQVVDRVLVDRAVAATGVDEVAVRAPACADAPGWRAALGDDGGYGRSHAAVPDSKGAVLRGFEEG